MCDATAVSAMIWVDCDVIFAKVEFCFIQDELVAFGSTVVYTITRYPEISERLITMLFVTDFEARAALNL